MAVLFHKMSPQHEPWTFAFDVPVTPVIGSLDNRVEVITAADEKQFVHGSSVIATSDGLLATWYRAPYEGAHDAELVSSRFNGSTWSPQSVVTDSAQVSRDFGITIKSLANPVSFRRSDSEIWLFFAASRLSGWATCEIGLIRSHDGGRTWGHAERLQASPFLNISHLTKSVPIMFSDGRIGLPAYHEMNRKYPVLLVLDQSGRVVDRRRMGSGGKVGFQPSIVPTGPSTAIAFVRRLRQPQSVLITRTSDGGKTWSHSAPVDLPNPGGPISAVRYDSTHILLAFNDDPLLERNITLALTDLEGKAFQRVGVVARMDGENRKSAVTYPYLIASAPGQFDIVYSRPLKSINHVRFSSAWVQQRMQPQTAQQR
ncbi:sialidase family protein [Hyphomicrobium sp.]|uniref:sialidase family protein n=1 Tax=Hyphomicrobium sp. TaxID=82 RepID=UPI002D7855F8|nr:sialidase family protein [Hyphomicrobium sp.]HET6389318.1 sialidase family protein [Hyphomicrobium sp.]